MTDPKTCSKCKRKLPATLEFFHRHTRVKCGLYSQCKPCKNAHRYSKKGREVWRAKNKRYRQTPKGVAMLRRKETHRLMKNQAVSKVNGNVRTGALPQISKVACVKCGEKAAQYHHPDYDRPLDVLPVCVPCHQAIHADTMKPMITLAFAGG